jgi:23S rRNA (pseudouridine1915-N3)-methyltransferase
VGRDRRSPTAELTADYLRRAAETGRGLGIGVAPPTEVEPPKGLKGTARQLREAELLAAGVGNGPYILLDERGSDWRSPDLAGRIAGHRDEGQPGLAFLLGGPDGFARDLADIVGRPPVAKLRFGSATWPHLLARVMLAEQLYRALTILAGHPYHRD